MSKRPVGRPRKYTRGYLAEIVEKLERYIEETSVPVVAEFAYQNKIPRQALYDHEDLLDIAKSTPTEIGGAMAEDHSSGDRIGNQAFLPVSKLSGFIRFRVSREIMHKVRFCEVL